MPAEPRGSAEIIADSTADEDRNALAGPGDLLTDDELLRSSPRSCSHRPSRSRCGAWSTCSSALIPSASKRRWWWSRNVWQAPHQLRRIAGGHQILTTPEMGGTISDSSRRAKLSASRAALETLSVIAYRQPSRGAIRGVQAGPMPARSSSAVWRA